MHWWKQKTEEEHQRIKEEEIPKQKEEEKRKNKEGIPVYDCINAPFNLSKYPGTCWGDAVWHCLHPNGQGAYDKIQSSLQVRKNIWK